MYSTNDPDSGVHGLQVRRRILTYFYIKNMKIYKIFKLMDLLPALCDEWEEVGGHGLGRGEESALLPAMMDHQA